MDVPHDIERGMQQHVVAFPTTNYRNPSNNSATSTTFTTNSMNGDGDGDTSGADAGGNTANYNSNTTTDSGSNGENTVEITALEEVVSVNSFFTVAVFIGISFTTSAQTSVATSCDADADVLRRLVVNEVLAFSFYLFSTLVAQGLKLQIQMKLSSADTSSRLLKPSLLMSTRGPTYAHINGFGRPVVIISTRLLRAAIAVSALGSLAGSVFLMLSIINVVEMKLGLVSCHNSWTMRAIIPLIILCSLGMISFLSPLLYAVLSASYRVWRPAPAAGAAVSGRNNHDDGIAHSGYKLFHSPV